MGDACNDAQGADFTIRPFFICSASALASAKIPPSKARAVYAG